MKRPTANDTLLDWVKFAEVLELKGIEQAAEIARLHTALTLLIDINGDRMTWDEWTRYDAALAKEDV